MPVPSDNLRLWQEYCSTKDSELRNELILRYTHLVKRASWQLGMCFNGVVDHDDLVGFGIFGLIDAVSKFDINRNVKFETYASLRIRGSIMDGIRSIDWVPRSARRKCKKSGKLCGSLEDGLGCMTGAEAVPKRPGENAEKLAGPSKKTGIIRLLSLDDLAERNLNRFYAVSNCKNYEPDSQLEAYELRRTVRIMLGCLPMREKTVIKLYYIEGFNLREISRVMKLTEPRVSQIHTRAMTKLRELHGKYQFMFTE